MLLETPVRVRARLKVGARIMHKLLTPEGNW